MMDYEGQLKAKIKPFLPIPGSCTYQKASASPLSLVALPVNSVLSSHSHQERGDKEGPTQNTAQCSTDNAACEG